MQQNAARAQEVDVARLLGTVRHYLLGVALVTAAASLGAYVLARQETPVYQASNSIIAEREDTQNPLLHSTIVTAPPLPPGALAEALHSSEVLADISRRTRRAGLSPEETGAITTGLGLEQRHHSEGASTLLRLDARLDAQQSGVYEVVARANTPGSAAALVDATVDALLAWDKRRATLNVAVARQNLERQLLGLNTRLSALNAGGASPAAADRQALRDARTTLIGHLAQLNLLEQASVGTLLRVGEAVEPTRPVSPRPLRDAAMAGALALALSLAGAVGFEALRRRVRRAEDLETLGVPVLARLPRVSRQALSRGVVELTRSGDLHSQAGFVRVNLSTLMSSERRRVFAVTSSRAGEGKSSVTAALACSMASAGLRTLVVDADLQHPAQLKLWKPTADMWCVLDDAAGQDSLLPGDSKFLPPAAMRVMRISDFVDLLPVKPAEGEPLSVSQLCAYLEHWAQAYDVVLIDTSPILSSAESLALAALADGVLLVVEPGRASLQDVVRSLNTARTAGANVTGFVMNKTSRDNTPVRGPRREPDPVQA